MLLFYWKEFGSIYWTFTVIIFCISFYKYQYSYNLYSSTYLAFE